MRTTTRPPTARRRNAAIAAGAGLITAAALLLGGCGSSSTEGGTTTSDQMPSMSNMPAVPSTTNEITISNFEFKVPESVTPGETLTIRNNDSTEHSVTADASGSFSVDIPANGTATMTVPDQAGTFPFHCKYHSSMHGKLTVS